MRPELERFWGLLVNEARGRAKAIKCKDLAKMFGTTKREIMIWRHELVVDFGFPIAAAKKKPFGLYLALTHLEKEEYLRTLDATLRETFALRRAFSKASIEELVQQGLFDEPEDKLAEASEDYHYMPLWR